MKKYIKYLIGTLFFIGLCTNSIGNNKIYATSTLIKDPDILPPTGSISVDNANHTDGVYNISFRDIILNITASDNRTESGDLLMIVSSNKLSDTDIIDDENWEPYVEQKEWILDTNNNGVNHVYLYLKDEAGNVSNSLLITTSDSYKVTYSGDGENLPDEKTTILRISI